MKNVVGLIAGSLILFSTSAIAKPDDFVTKTGDKFYIGADITAANSVDITIHGASADETADLGFNLLAGYEFNTHPLVKTSVEAEYRNFGEADSTGVLKVDGNALFVNAKAKLFVQYDFGNLYLAPMVGVGQISIDGSTSNTSFSETELAYQAGVELGTRLRQGVDLHLGYRATFTTVNYGGSDIDVDLSGAYIGARYFF
ncbi:porin family protein [Vibrio sinensis]|uniref:Porin family protein n=1 Tax=Vibrio sinensis TaxID=2302434 RepID=A0A3A6QHB2_9VIBR|nr:outer membrane beta-barrel protein [Vibrio sinensis]RJX68895.1 porin family protein [Vibrio sinensis]